jgi:hypothetical protein
MAKSLAGKLPKHLRKAIKDRVMTFQEAELWDVSYMVQCHLRWVHLPKALHPACERMWLYQQPATKQ